MVGKCTHSDINKNIIEIVMMGLIANTACVLICRKYVRAE